MEPKWSVIVDRPEGQLQEGLYRGVRTGAGWGPSVERLRLPHQGIEALAHGLDLAEQQGRLGILHHGPLGGQQGGEINAEGVRNAREGLEAGIPVPVLKQAIRLAPDAGPAGNILLRIMALHGLA